VVDSKEYSNVCAVLTALYEKQGYLYEALGIPWGDAWRLCFHPEDSTFSNNCDGFKRFLKEVGSSEDVVLSDWIREGKLVPKFSSSVEEEIVNLP